MSMTTELARRMKAAAQEALARGELIISISTGTFIEVIETLEKEKDYASAYEAEKWHYHGLAESEGERANRAEARLEAAEKRIAELEARTVTLPSINPQMFNDDVMFGYRKAQKEAVEFCAAAGISIAVESE